MIFTTLENKNKKTNISLKAGSPPALGGIFRKILKRLITVVFVVAFWYIVWYALAAYIDKEVILPYPNSVLLKLKILALSSEFWLYCGSTILRILSGIFFGSIFGILLAFVIFSSNTVRTLVSPLLSAVKATPVASFIIAALFWLSRGEVPTFISFLIVLPVICDSVYTGIKNADNDLLELAAVYKFSFFKRLRYIRIPSAIPYFLSALNTSIGMAWKAGVAAEVLCTPQNSIGKELYSTKVYMETADMFAWTLVVILLSIIFEKISVGLVKKGLKKYTHIKKENTDEA